MDEDIKDDDVNLGTNINAESSKTLLLEELHACCKENSTLCFIKDTTCEDGRVILEFSFGPEETFMMYCPLNYPQYRPNHFFVESVQSLQVWSSILNEFIMESRVLLSLKSILEKAILEYSISKNVCEEDANSTSTSSSEVDDYDDDDDDDEFIIIDDSRETLEREYNLSLKRRLWQQKESELRASTKQPKTSDMFGGLVKDHPQQIFSNSAASGILTNDLLTIIKSSKESGISADAIDDNIYKWTVRLSSFNPSSKLNEDMKLLHEKYGYNYVELQLDFAMDLYPFYPPTVKVVRPRFHGYMMVASMDVLKFVNWNAAKDMKSVLLEVKRNMATWVRLDFNSERNNRLSYPNGSYIDIENYLLSLASVCETHIGAYQEHSEGKAQAQWTKQVQPRASSLASLPAGTGSWSLHHKGWDINAYNAALKQKDSDLEFVLQRIHFELQKEFTFAKTLGLSLPYSNPSKVEDTYTSFFIPTNVCNNISTISPNCFENLHSNDVIVSKQDTEETSENAEYNGTIILIDDLYLILESSTLLPFLQARLKEDSFLEICKHTIVYNCIVDIIKEIATQPKLVPLLWDLPNQTQSIYQLTCNLSKRAEALLMKTAQLNIINKNGNPSSFEFSCQDSLEVTLAKKFCIMNKNVEAAVTQLGLLATEGAVECCTSDKAQAIKQSPDDEDITNTYIETLKDFQFLSCDIEVNGPCAHHFAALFKPALPPQSAQMMRIVQEMDALSTSLPLELGSAIFVRTDDSKYTLLKALIIGPEGTPYSGGCFQFDIFFSPLYPKAPPSVYFCTTGGNKVRFNPNLYHNGTVCLSLLGTWNGNIAEKWHPETSTLLQVLVSIQSLIFVPDPFFNEPGYSGYMGTTYGKIKSKAYNQRILQYTIQLAMIEQLQRPCPGFEQVIQHHFQIKKNAILKEIKDYINSNEEIKLNCQINQLWHTLERELNKLPPLEKMGTVKSSADGELVEKTGTDSAKMDNNQMEL